jgi:phosphatidylserine/phosphatidylglycerophosphate/cardiolipin synthase-like enzyme
MERKGFVKGIEFLILFPIVAIILLGASRPVAITPLESPAPIVRTVAKAPALELDGPYFSPNGGGESAIVRHINAAKKSLRILAYSFTSDGIITAVISAKNRGVDVVAVLDKSHMKERNGAAERFKNAGVTTLIDGKHAIQHNKTMIIDGIEVVTGSYNFTKSANERNAENVLMLKSADVAAGYTTNFKIHEGHAVPFNPGAVDKNLVVEPEGE